MDIKSAKRAFEVGGVQYHRISELFEEGSESSSSEKARLARVFRALAELDSEVREKARDIFESEGLSDHGFSASLEFCYSSEMDRSESVREVITPASAEDASNRAWKYDISIGGCRRKDGVYFESILVPGENSGNPVRMWRVYWPVEESSPMWIGSEKRGLKTPSSVCEYIDKNWPMKVEST